MGAGTFDMGATRRDEADQDFRGDWVQDYAETFQPEKGPGDPALGKPITSTTTWWCAGHPSGHRRHARPARGLETDVVCSNYIDPEKTLYVLKNFQGGNAVFTQPAASDEARRRPQKAVYLADEYLPRAVSATRPSLPCSPPLAPVIFGVEPFRFALRTWCASDHPQDLYKPVASIPCARRSIS